MRKYQCTILICSSVLVVLACGNSSPNEPTAATEEITDTADMSVSIDASSSSGSSDTQNSNAETGNSLNSLPANSSQVSSNYCAQFTGQTDPYFCEDFSDTSPSSLAGLIPPMSFRDQTYRRYTLGELFHLADPTADSHSLNVLDLHTDLIDGMDFSHYARQLQSVAEKWDITAHSRDGYIQPGTGSGFNDNYWWNEQFLMAGHGNRCSKPIDLTQRFDPARNDQRGFTFMEEIFAIPADYNGDENTLSNYWAPQYERFPDDATGIHPVLRYEDMIYVCADHLMTAAYATGASKLSITPNQLLDTSADDGSIEFSVSTYRTAGRDYWQVDLTPLNTHLQLPEGDVVADANGKAVNGFNINTSLDEGPNGIADILGNFNVFRTMMVKDGEFLINGEYIDPTDPAAQYTRAQIANRGNPERLALYNSAPDGENWVITHRSYNQVMYDYLDGDNNPEITLHNVTDNRTRARFRLTVQKTPVNSVWDAEQWDQVSLCMPDYGNQCVGEYIVPELANELLVQFTHYAYNTTKSCDNNVGQPHDKPGAAFQSLCHPNTYHWDNFYLSPGKLFTIVKSIDRTGQQDGNTGEALLMQFEKPALANSKLRFNALTAGINGETTLEISFDNGSTWHKPDMQYEPENDFAKFRSYFTGTDTSEFIPAGTRQVLFRADNPDYRNAFWIRDVSFWSLP